MTSPERASASQPNGDGGDTPRPLPTEDGFRVGAWWVEPKGDRLCKGPHCVRVEPKAMDVLVYLATRAGEVVSREDLEQGVWRGALVGYDAVTKTVIKLRQALGDNPRDPHYIQTVPKRGYRLVAEVGPPDQGGGLMVPDRIERLARLGRPVFYGLALGCAVLASLLLYLWVSRPETSPGEAPGSGAVTDAAVATRTSVVVHPFEVLSRDPDQLYLARGLTADLIADLSRFSGLRVTGAATAGGSPDSEGAPPQGARYEVWGGVQRVDERIRAEVRLTDAPSGRQLSIERYDRPFADLFEIQDEIGTRLAKALSLKLSQAEQLRVAHRYTPSVDAYDLFLQAQAELLTRGRAENERARGLYLRAIERDPAFARAYGGLALTYAAEYRNQWSSDGKAALTRALAMAETAAEIDPTLAEVQWALGYVKAQQRRHREALAHLDHALRLEPRFADALALKGGIETYTGKPEATIPLVRGAMRLNPDSGYLYYMILGRAYFFLGDSVQAEINLREAALRNPETLEVRVFLAAALERRGEHEAAQWEGQEILAMRPDFSTQTWLETYPMTDRDQQQRLVDTLARLGL